MTFIGEKMVELIRERKVVVIAKGTKCSHSKDEDSSELVRIVMQRI